MWVKTSNNSHLQGDIEKNLYLIQFLRSDQTSEFGVEGTFLA